MGNYVVSGVNITAVGDIDGRYSAVGLDGIETTRNYLLIVQKVFFSKYFPHENIWDK